jgi:predicted acylesterase/phospholipase RssA
MSSGLAESQSRGDQNEGIIVMPDKSKAVVISGGGTVGGAWMLGFIHGLREEGVDLGDVTTRISQPVTMS